MCVTPLHHARSLSRVKAVSTFLFHWEISLYVSLAVFFFFFFFFNWTQIDFKRSPQSRPGHGFRPKRNHFRGQSSRRALFGHARCWSIAKCSQRSCRNFTGGFRSWLPATCTTRTSFDHHGKRSGILYKKWVLKNEKKSYLSLIWKWWKREMTARLPVTVSSVQTWFYM